MKRFALALAASMLVACSSDDSPNCDPEFYDCTPTDYGGDGNGGNNGGGNNGGNGGDDTPPRNHPTYTQDELRELGVIFPGDEGWSFDPVAVGVDADVQPPWMGVDGFRHHFGTHTDDADWLQAFWDDMVAAEYTCNPWHLQTALIWHIRSEQPLDVKASRISGTCIQTAYGAGVLLVPEVNELIERVDSSFAKPEGAEPPTCHPTIDGIAFTRQRHCVGDSCASWAPIAYTVGSIFDARVPVSDCRP